MKLRTKATLFFAGFLITLGTAIVFYAEVVVGGAFKKQITSHFHIIAEQTKNAFLAYIDGTKTQTLDWVSGTTFQQKAIAVLDSPANSSARARHAKEFADYVKKYKMPFDPSIVMVDLLDKNGIVVASTDPVRMGMNEGAEIYYGFNKMIISNVGEVYTKGIVYEEDEHAEPMTHTTARLFSTNAQGVFEPQDGVLLIHFSSVEKLSKILRGESTAGYETPTHETLLTSYQTSDVYLVNEDHFLVTHARNGATTHTKQTVDTLPVRTCFDQGREINDEYDNYMGTRVFGASECFADEGLVLIIEAEKSEVFAPLATLTRTTLTGGVMILIFGITIVLLFVRRPLQNVGEIVRAAEQVSMGDLTARADVATKDEVGYLASVFNKMVIAVRDVEKTLRASKQEIERERTNLKEAQGIAHLGSWVLDLKKNQLVWSAEAYRIFGVPFGTPLTYETFLERVHPDDRAYVDREWNAALKGKPYDIEHRILVDNTVRWVRERAELEVDEHGTILRGSGTTQDITDRKEAENELRTSRERYLSALDSMIEGCTIIGYDWKFLYLNNSAVKHSRRAREETIGYSLFETFPGIDQTAMYAAFKRCMEERTPQRIEAPLTFPDGYTGWFDLSINPVLEGIFILSIDITERKKAGKVLLQLNTAVQSSGEAVFMTDQEGVFTFINPEFTRLYGYSADEVIGKTTPRILKSGRQPTEYYEAFWGNIVRGKSTTNELINKTKNGSLINIEESVNPVIDDTGTMVGFLAIHRDITERARAAEALKTRDLALERANQELLAEKNAVEMEKAKDDALLSSIGEGMLATDETGHIIAINPAAEKLLGYHAHEIAGKKVVDVTTALDEHGVEMPTEERPITRVIATKEAVTLDTMYFRNKTGGQVPVTITVSPVILNDKLIGTIAIFRDITKEKELEETRRDLLSLASHQLRTPLSGTKWLIETLRRGIHGPLNDAQIEYLDEIYKINERMTTLVFDMLNVLRMESGVIPTQNVRVSTNSIVDTLIDTMEPAAKVRGVTLSVNPHENYLINTDPILLRNILENFVSNAINYSPAGKEVSIGITRTSSGIDFSIKDSGIGIPPDEQAQIFRRFYRASNAKTYNTRGTGLGLYIASILSKKIGALLSFESKEGEGSTFYVHVPYGDNGGLPENTTNV